MKKVLLMLPAIVLLFSCNNTTTVKVANPASEFCIKNNGKLEIRKDSLGNETGFCVFNINGKKSECEEFSYFRGECKPQQ